MGWIDDFNEAIKSAPLWRLHGIVEKDARSINPEKNCPYVPQQLSRGVPKRSSVARDSEMEVDGVGCPTITGGIGTKSRKLKNFCLGFVLPIIQILKYCK